jgi:cellulose biosynthesis protein BcsQ
MTESLAIFSGKGGSGKTTLALLLSQLLAVCGRRVLLIDCDMSTHGASYFFEDQLAQKNKYYTFSDILFSGINSNESYARKEIFEAATNIDFIPSCVEFLSKEHIKNNEISDLRFEGFIESIGVQNYDVIIYDCQAGYSVVTDFVTRFTKRNLSVIEADAISASSQRVLYSQLSEQLDHSKTYQVFNKITKEEQDIYSKLTHGTLFTNLTPIVFDWNLRKTLLTNDLPEINANNPTLTMDIYSIAFVLFPQYKDDFRKFLIDTKQRMISTLDYQLDGFNIRFRKKILHPLLFMSSTFCCIFSIVIMVAGFVSGFSLVYMGALFSVFFILIVTTVFLGLSFNTEFRNERLKIKKGRERLEEEISQIKQKLRQEEQEDLFS